jgi:hypothetical protein
MITRYEMLYILLKDDLIKEKEQNISPGKRRVTPFVKP